MAEPSPLPAATVLRRLLRLFGPHRGRVLGGLGLLVLGTAFSVAAPLLIKIAIDVLLPARDTRGLLIACGLFVYLQALVVALRLLQVRLLEGAAQQIIGELRERVLRHALALPVPYHDRHSAGRLLAHIEGDVELLRGFYATSGVRVIESILMFGMLLGVMLAVDAPLALVAGASVPVLGLLVLGFHRVVSPRYLVMRERTADMTAELAEFVQGTAVLQSLRAEPEAARRFGATNFARYAEGVAVETRVVLFWNLLFLVESLAQVAIWGAGSLRVISGASALGTLVLFSDLVRRAYEPIHHLADDMQSTLQATAAAQKIFQLLDAAPEPVPASPAAPREPDRSAPAVELDGVWFAYQGEEWVLRDLSLSIPAGEHWAIVGATGSGKSTLVSLLLRFYAPQRGVVRLGGRDLAELDPAVARAGVGYVPQELLLFPGTLLDNLALGPVDREAARQAARRLGLEPLIARLPGGWDAEIAERGLNLSAGERQLVCAARALATDPPLLVLDEATSAVDPRSERALQRAIGELRAGRTLISVAHRLSTIEDADRIVVLDRGRIAESGRHAELVARDGIYARLHLLQLGRAGHRLAGAAL